MTGWSSRRYVSSASTSVHQVASRSASGQVSIRQADLGELEAPVAVLVPDRLVEEPRHLAEGVVGHRRGPRRRPSPPRATGASDRAGPRCARSGSRRSAPAGIVAGRAPRTKRAAFHSLLAKLRAFSSLAAPNCWSLPGRRAVDEGEAERVGARTRRSSPSGSTTLPFVLRHLLAVRVADEARQVDRVERRLAGQVDAEHHHPGDPEEDDVVAGLHDRARVVAARGRRSASGQPSVENGHRPELNQVSKMSGSWASSAAGRPHTSQAAGPSGSALTVDVAVRAVPGRDPVAPPQLARLRSSRGCWSASAPRPSRTARAGSASGRSASPRGRRPRAAPSGRTTGS